MTALLWASSLALLGSSCTLLRPRLPSIEPLTAEDLNARTGSHRVALVDSGWKALALRVQLIRSARESIDLQTFIWSEDEAGKLIAHELILASRRGVRVRALSDGMHTRMDVDLAAHMASASAHLELKAYNPNQERLRPAIPALTLETLVQFTETNKRAHDKIMIVDGEKALLGGRNLENTYFDYAAGSNFKDREILVIGPVVEDACASFNRFWEYEDSRPWSQLKDVAERLEAGLPNGLGEPARLGILEISREVTQELERASDISDLLSSRWFDVDRVAFSGDPPGKGDLSRSEARTHVSQAMAGLVRAAETSVLVQTPYFILTEPAMGMLGELRQEHPGVLLRASTNSLASTDIFPAQAAAYRQKRRVIETLGIHLYEMKARPEDLPDYIAGVERLEERTGVPPALCLHSKSFVIDGEIAGVGTHNIGPRSARLNTELMLFVWDREFASALTESIEMDMRPGNSWVVWKRERPPLIGEVQSIMEQLSGAVGDLTSIDIWPSNYASCFELNPGAEAVAPDHPEFYERYSAVGLFPGTDGEDGVVTLTRLLKAVGGFVEPLL